MLQDKSEENIELKDNKQSAHTELFLDPKLKYYSNNNRSNASDNNMKRLQKYKRQFSCPPIGEYIQYTKRLIYKLFKMSYQWKDQQLFNKIVKQTFGVIVSMYSI